jgi:hypothetical protein
MDTKWVALIWFFSPASVYLLSSLTWLAIFWTSLASWTRRDLILATSIWISLISNLVQNGCDQILPLLVANPPVAQCKSSEILCFVSCLHDPYWLHNSGWEQSAGAQSVSFYNHADADDHIFACLIMDSGTAYLEDLTNEPMQTSFTFWCRHRTVPVQIQSIN